MENYKDLILQALNYGCFYISPTETESLYLVFRENTLNMFLDRLNVLCIYPEIKYNPLNENAITIKLN